MTTAMHNWMYIRFRATDHVISASPRIATQNEDPLRSQAYVCPLERTSEQMWRWQDGFLQNKATNMVLDIRKGRLRLIEDTEICLYTMKESALAQNQLWGVREAKDMLDRPLPGSLIYSVSNTDWVLDVSAESGEGAKLILCQHVDGVSHQCWDMVPVDESTGYARSVEPSTVPSSTHHILTPSQSSSSSHDYDTSALSDYSSASKRDSQSSTVSVTLNEYKESHQKIYLEQDPHVSDDTIGRAAAYQTWQHWKQEQMTLSRVPLSTAPVDQDGVLRKLQELAKHEASHTFERCDQLISHADVAPILASQYVAQLCRIPTTP